jgi:putative two-component system hydrogenase maturation factor HypX/HoxX
VQRILFLVSADNSLAQRAALRLRAAGHSVRTAVVDDETDMLRAVAPKDFDLIICPYLKARIPEAIYRTWRTVVIHPGPPGDRGPSSLDWAILEREITWGVTALSAVEEMDAGSIWSSATFSMPAGWRKSAVYAGPMSDAAINCIMETVARAADPKFQPTPLTDADHPVAHARWRPLITQADRAFDWSGDASLVAIHIQAADGFPGVSTRLADRDMFVYDVHVEDTESAEEPGTITGRHDHAIRVACGSGSVWIGYLRRRASEKTCKGPALTVLAADGLDVDCIPEVEAPMREVRYLRHGDIGVVTMDFYNGTMSTAQCDRLAAAVRHAAAQNTRVLVVRGSLDSPFLSNGIHLGAIELARSPELEAWNNIKAINQVCREILMCTKQVTIGAFTGNAGAGGVMMPLGADVIAARDGVVLNPHYATMGLAGSELHSYTLARRVGAGAARRLLDDGLPIDAFGACGIGLVDELGPRHDFDAWLLELATDYAADHRWSKTLTAKRDRLAGDLAHKPLDAYEYDELGAMSQDIFLDRNDFALKRHNFICKIPRKKAQK